MGAQAVALYKRVLDEEPSSAAALDALEKQAERDKDFATVADVLERRTARRARRRDAAHRAAEARQHLLRPPARSREGDERVAARARAPARARQGAARAARQLPRRRRLRRPDGALRADRATGRVSSTCSRAPPTRTTDPDLKVDLSFRCADVYAERLEAPERAFRAYERVLSVRPGRRPRRRGPRAPLREGREVGPAAGALRDPARATPSDLDEKLALLEKLVQVTRPRSSRTARRRSRGPQGLRARAGARGRARGASRRAARAAEQWAGSSRPSRARLESSRGGPAGRAAQARKRRRGTQDGERDGGRREELRAQGAKLAEVYAREMGRVDEAIPRTAGSSTRTRPTTSRCRRSTASCARPTGATICAGSSSSASSAPTRR